MMRKSDTGVSQSFGAAVAGGGGPGASAGGARAGRAGGPGRGEGGEDGKGGVSGAEGRNGADKADQGGGDPQQKTKIECLEQDLARRQESYIRRERAYKTRVEELEAQLEDMREAKISWMTSDKSMAELKSMHKRIINNVEIVQDRTAKILQEQEKDLLRAFRARLFDIQTELEKEKSRRDDGAGAWIDKSRKLEGELDWTTEVADRLDRMNQQLLKENSRLKTQFKLQDEDRAYLTKQLVAIKRDNAKLKQELDAATGALRAKEDEVERLSSELNQAWTGKGGGATGQAGASGGGGGGGFNSQNRDLVSMALGANGSASAIRAEADSRFKEIIRKLKRTLDLERRNLRAVRERLSEELQGRTELQTFLRQCVEDVRKQIAEINAPARSTVKPSVSIDDFTAADREKTLSLLLSQDRVISLLYAKAFPVRTPGFGERVDEASNASGMQGTFAPSQASASFTERPMSAPSGSFASPSKPPFMLNSMMKMKTSTSSLVPPHAS